MVFRWFAARLEPLPEVGTIFKHRDIDLYLRVVNHIDHRFKSAVVVVYGYLDDKGEFITLPNRHKRVKSNFSLHKNYDQV